MDRKVRHMFLWSDAPTCKYVRLESYALEFFVIVIYSIKLWKFMSTETNMYSLKRDLEQIETLLIVLIKK